MKILDKIKDYDREVLLDLYFRLVDNSKSNIGLSKVKLIRKIYDVYMDYNNVINLCTLRELSFLDKCFNGKIKKNIKGYDFEKNTLLKKMLLCVDKKGFLVVPFEIRDSVKNALCNYDIDSVNNLDRINEILVSFLKVQGCKETYTVISVCNVILKLSDDDILEHVFNNLCFKFYVDLVKRKVPRLKDKFWFFVFRDYKDLMDELELERNNSQVLNLGVPNYDSYKSIFYNDFDLTNSDVKKFYDSLRFIKGDRSVFISDVLKVVLLNGDRSEFKKNAQNYNLIGICLEDFFDVLDKAMDSMPSGVLNGLSSKEFLRFKEEKFKRDYEKSKSYVKQENACLDYQDACLFGKLYYGLLEFTNKKFKVRPKYKFILGYDNMDLSLICEAFWEKKDEIIDEFCLENPFGFDDSELELVCEFKKGIRSVFIVMEFLENYTTFMSSDITYMVKGLNRNMDEIFSFNSLPLVVYTTILPFNGSIVFDGIAIELEMNAGFGIDQILDDIYNNLDKCYHL